jgi:AcrR family transcriptional regulator
MRADAQRNRDRILRVAHDAFATDGPGVPIDDIARRAGVGAGTVYRHFPTKDSLFEAVVVAAAEPILARAEELGEARDPGAAFFTFLAYLIEQRVEHRGLAEASAGPDIDPASLTELSRLDRRILDAMLRLLTRAQASGAVRGDLRLVDVKALVTGAVAMRRELDDAERVLGLLMEGVRPRT